MSQISTPTARPGVDHAAPSPAKLASLPLLAMRGAIGGVLMGLANLVPGISGGTMLLAAGVYPKFIAAIGEVTTLKFKRSSLVVLGSVGIMAVLAFVLLARPVVYLVVNHRWAMYSLFIGLTLGGVPVVWRLVTAGGRQADRAVWLGAVGGFVGMASLAIYQSSGAGAGAYNDGFIYMLCAGAAGASAMILPGISGAYLLLILGVYLPLLTGVDAFKDGLKAMDMQALISVGMAVVLPVGLGVLLGVVGVSNLLRWLLKNYEKATLGVLLGLLIGAVVGLWPFQHSVEPEAGMMIKGQALFEHIDEQGGPVWLLGEGGELLEPEDLPTASFTPTAIQVAGSIALILLGFGLTLGVDRLGREKPKH